MRNTTLMQWRAYELCAIEGRTYKQAAPLLGVKTPQAVGRRVRAYMERMGLKRFTGRRRVVPTVSLDSLSDV